MSKGRLKTGTSRCAYCGNTQGPPKRALREIPALCCGFYRRFAATICTWTWAPPGKYFPFFGPASTWTRYLPDLSLRVVLDFQVTVMRPPFLIFLYGLTYSPTRTLRVLALLPLPVVTRRYIRTRTRRVVLGTVALSLIPLRCTSRSDMRRRMLRLSTDGAARRLPELLLLGLPFAGTGLLPPGTLRLLRSPISEGCAVHVRPGSGLIGQPGSDMTRIRPHIPASVNGRR